MKKPVYNHLAESLHTELLERIAKTERALELTESDTLNDHLRGHIGGLQEAFYLLHEEWSKPAPIEEEVQP